MYVVLYGSIYVVLRKIIFAGRHTFITLPKQKVNFHLL